MKEELDFLTNKFIDRYPMSMKAAIKKTGLPLKERKVFKFLREIGALDEYNMPSYDLQQRFYMTYEYRNVTYKKSANIPRIDSREGYNWFFNLMKANIDKVS